MTVLPLRRVGRFEVRAWWLFEPRDVWVGLFWKFDRVWLGEPWVVAVLRLYVCLLPCLPLKIEIGWRCR